jgi:ribosomal-protein-alanine N-acetyltransferase
VTPETSPGAGRAPGTKVGETPRLVLRRFTLDDAEFVRELVNEPGWLRFIGDRNVHTPEQACAYIEKRLLGPYARLGFGFYRVELKRDGTPVGLCGLVRRDGLDDVDLGFGLLERCAGLGYAREAAVEVVRQAREELALTRLVAITLPDNQRSIALLEKLGMRLERTLRLPGEQADLSLYGMGLRAP